MSSLLKHISKHLSLVLRHQPESIGIQVDENGWADVQTLLRQMHAHGTTLDLDTLEMLVSTNDKQRFSFNEDHTWIRANQGHSIDVELNLQPTMPPDLLFHGTADRFVASILNEGLLKQQRQYLHLSWNTETALAVGSRHGKPVILHIDAKAMSAAGFQFFLSANNVWLTEHVPAQYISLPELNNQ